MNQILVAEDEPLTRRTLVAALSQDGYTVSEAVDGTQAWHILQSPQAPSLAILDWMMPGLNGIELCQALRNSAGSQNTYLILLTSKGEHKDIVTGLEGGADDYMVKPFDSEELRARVRVGLRVVDLQGGLTRRVRELEQALVQIKQLQGLLPICSYCKKIRDDRNYWRLVDEYLSEHAAIKFSHAICPTCYKTELAPQLKALKSAVPPRA